MKSQDTSPAKTSIGSPAPDQEMGLQDIERGDGPDFQVPVLPLRPPGLTKSRCAHPQHAHQEDKAGNPAPDN